MGAMFADCPSFNQPLQSWDVSSVRDMNWMFRGCARFDQCLEGWGWGVSRVENITDMFERCVSLKNKPSWYEWLVEKCQDEFDDECDETLE